MTRPRIRTVQRDGDKFVPEPPIFVSDEFAHNAWEECSIGTICVMNS